MEGNCAGYSNGGKYSNRVINVSDEKELLRHISQILKYHINHKELIIYRAVLL